MNRADLIKRCQESIQPMEDWCGRNAAMYHDQTGILLMLLLAGAEYRIVETKHGQFNGCSRLVTVIEIKRHTFSTLENSDPPQAEIYYLPFEGTWY